MLGGEGELMAILSLNEIYASGGQMPVICLEITNAAIGTLRFVLAYEDMEIDGQTYRASAFTIQLPERSDNGFSDRDSISDYAKEAVGKLHALKILNGYGAEFMPKGLCTRAEAVQAIYSYIKAVEAVNE